MNTYFSTFFTGFSELISKTLKTQLPDSNIIQLVDGLVVYSTTAPSEKINQLAFFNNNYLLLKQFNNIKPKNVTAIMRNLLKSSEAIQCLKQSYNNKHLSFRIRASVENQFASTDKGLLAALEGKITSAIPGLTINRSLPDFEILILLRSEGFALVGAQISKRPNYEKTLHKGELYPELAYLMCLISDPDENDIFLDPFAGYGAILNQRLQFPYKQLQAYEKDILLTKQLINKFGTKVRVVTSDFFTSNIFVPGSITKIITDPPWGIFNSQINAVDFYMRMLTRFEQVLVPDGVAVVLTAQKELLESLINRRSKKWILENKINTLVSGKKAGVYKLILSR